MTREEYGKGYEEGYRRTVRFLISRGLSAQSAEETAQGAWVRGWEKMNQLRDSRLLMTWVNTIALNLHRRSRRRSSFLLDRFEVYAPQVNVAAIDIRGILKTCKTNDRLVLQRHYIEGYTVREIASAHGWTETAVRIRLLRARRAAKVLAA